MSSLWGLFTIRINLFNMVAYVLLRGVKQFHNLLYCQPHILTLESHIDPSYSVVILINQECLISLLYFVCHILVRPITVTILQLRPIGFRNLVANLHIFIVSSKQKTGFLKKAHTFSKISKLMMNHLAIPRKNLIFTATMPSDKKNAGEVSQIGTLLRI